MSTPIYLRMTKPPTSSMPNDLLEVLFYKAPKYEASSLDFNSPWGNQSVFSRRHTAGSRA